MFNRLARKRTWTKLHRYTMWYEYRYGLVVFKEITILVFSLSLGEINESNVYVKYEGFKNIGKGIF